MKLFYKDPYVKTLTQFSKFLLSNKDTTIINNRKLPGPNPTIKKDMNPYKVLLPVMDYLRQKITKI